MSYKDKVKHLSKRNSIFSAINLGLMQRLLVIFYPFFRCLMKERERKIQRLMQHGDSKITRAIDIMTILRLKNTLKTLLRLEKSKSARGLLNLQRKETVLDLYYGSESESENSSVDSKDQLRNLAKLSFETKLEKELLDGVFVD